MDNLTAFMSLIAFSESTSTSPITKNNGYDIIVSGVDGRHSFTDYTDHPFADGRPSIVVNHSGLISSASGRYQIELHWWKSYKQKLNLPDFSPTSQDAYCVQVLKERHADTMILAGNIQCAIEACSNIWASFPGNNYGQGGRPMQTLLTKYNEIKCQA